ncbi:hypothetical protein MASR2M36_27920 [Providencia sp.]
MEKKYTALYIKINQKRFKKYDKLRWVYMFIIKDFSVENGGVCYINHDNDNFTIINCNINIE